MSDCEHIEDGVKLCVLDTRLSIFMTREDHFRRSVRLVP
jgi:hypothetical protein